MTLCIAHKDKQHLYIAHDSSIFFNNDIIPLKKVEKVFYDRDHVAIISGVYTQGLKVIKNLGIKIADKTIEYILDNIEINKEEDENDSSDLLLFKKGKFYLITSMSKTNDLDFVLFDADFFAIGAQAKMAEGVWNAVSKYIKDPIKRIAELYDVISNSTVTVRFPVCIEYNCK